MIKAEIVAIGDEILIGQVLNTNAQWIAQRLNEVGVKPHYFSSISDSESSIVDAVKNGLERSDIMFITGGLGPTKDDITKHTLAKYFKSELIINEDRLQFMKDFCERRGKQLSELNKTQALVPDNCFVINNEVGSACGMWFKDDKGKIIISMPGVPYEMKDMMNKIIIPKIQEEMIGVPIVHRTIRTFGAWESVLAEEIEEWEENLPDFISLAYLPKIGMVRLRLSGQHKDEVFLNKEIDKQVSLLYKLIPQHIYGEEDDELESVVGQLLKTKGQTIATAESCTGGYISHKITSVSGSSSYYKGSVIAYSNEIKVQELNVEKHTLDNFGAVSEQTVSGMAEGIRSKYNTDFGLACSGIAGPDGGTEDKPVGTIWIAIASKDGIKTEKLMLSRTREFNIHLTALYTLNLLRNMLVV